MSSAAITTRNQLTLPRAIREKLGVGPGDRVDFLVDADGRVFLAPVNVDLRSLRGSVRTARKGIPLEDMDAAARAR